jgi:hypothetical protein
MKLNEDDLKVVDGRFQVRQQVRDKLKAQANLYVKDLVWIHIWAKIRPHDTMRSKLYGTNQG